MVLVRHPVVADMSRKPAASPLLSISVLGGMSVNCAGHEIKLRSRKTQGLLAFLAIEAHAVLARSADRAILERRCRRAMPASRFGRPSIN